MNRLSFVFIAALLAAGLQTTRAQQNNAQGEKLLASAQHKATVDGDLKGAIEEYKKIVAGAGTNREVAAKALVRMAECYRKLGDAESRNIYQRVVRDYGEQATAVAEARARLRGRDTVTGANTMVLRNMWSGPEVAQESNVSPDGRFVSYPAWATGDLGLRDLVTGASRLLTINGYARNEYAQGSAISRDGKQVAYAWYNGKDRYELRLINLQSAGLPEPRRLLNNADVDFLMPFDWSPDGTWVAVWLQRKDRTSQIGLVSVSDGSLRVLKSIDWRGVSRMSLSPDGKYLGFDLSVSETDSNERDVFVMAVDGSRETRVVASPGHDRLMGWSPDGRTLLFASDRTGTLGLWGVPIADAQPQGAPFLIKADIAASSIGVTKSGALFTIGAIGSVDVRVASVDLNSGKLLAPPESVVRTFVGVNRAPDWSPDGTSLAYISIRGLGGRDRVIVIRSLATGQTRELSVDLDYSGQLRWAPDGRSFVTKGRDLKGRAGVFQIDAQTGAFTLLVPIPSESGNSFPELSPDGRKLYFWSGNVLRGTPGSRFVERDLASGSERVLFGAGGPTYPSLSPDGRYFAGIVHDRSALVLVPVTGGEQKELLRVKDVQTLSNYVTWTRDGSGVIVPVRGKAEYEPVLVPVSGGVPRKLELKIGQLGIRLHPDSRQVAFTAGTQMAELWVLENFLPVASSKK